MSIFWIMLAIPVVGAAVMTLLARRARRQEMQTAPDEQWEEERITPIYITPMIVATTVDPGPYVIYHRHWVPVSHPASAGQPPR